ncbi:MAG TPA: DUF4375 domain-containing protein [Phycisphaerae bacterium]|nr:DUF4375 domain-containing protein [Phycisphaerae bacterium]
MATRHNMRKILADHVDGPYDPKRREFIEEIASALYERHESFPQWPESVRLFYACYDINYQVGNGGFAQAAYNVPELLPMAQKAFERFGRKQAAGLCRLAIEMLPAELREHLDKGLRDRPQIQDVFEHFSESEMRALDENLPEEFWADDALQEHVQRHRKDFESIE